MLLLRRRAADAYERSGWFRLLTIAVIVFVHMLGLLAILHMLPPAYVWWQPVVVVLWAMLVATASTWVIVPPLDLPR